MATCYRKKLIIQRKNNVLDACENAFYKEYKDGDSVEFLYFMGGGC